MTNKELRKLRRVELLELLVEQGDEMEQLRSQLAEAQKALAQREILLEQAGSIAEAALALNKIFEAADQAARDYVDSVKAECDRRAAEILKKAESDHQAAEILEEAAGDREREAEQ